MWLLLVINQVSEPDRGHRHSDDTLALSIDSRGYVNLIDSQSYIWTRPRALNSGDTSALGMDSLSYVDFINYLHSVRTRLM